MLTNYLNIKILKFENVWGLIYSRNTVEISLFQ